MDRDDVRTELEQPGARTLLTTATLLRLAYLGADQFPRVIPIGFHWTGSAVVVCTATSAPKVAALSARPHVALTIDVGDTTPSAKALLLRGEARVELVEGVPEEYVLAATKVLDPAAVDAYREQLRSMFHRMARISVEPSWARYFDFGAGRVPFFMTQL